MWAVGQGLFLSYLSHLLVSAAVGQIPASVSLDRLPYLLRCGWSHLVIDGITLVVIHFVMHGLDCVRLSWVSPQPSVLYWAHALLRAAAQ